MIRANVKAMRVSDFPEEAWVILGEATGNDKELRELYATVDYLYRAVTIRADKLASVPFVILRGGTVVYDSAAEDDPPVGFEWLTRLPVLLKKIEAACCLAGRAYFQPAANDYGFVKALQWFKPSSIVPQYDIVTGELLYFDRHENSQVRQVQPADVCYIWPPDHEVEIGPATNYPGKAALAAAGVLANMDKFLAHYFDRGAIKVTLLTTEGMPSRGDRQLLKEWWQKVASGIKNAFTTEVINAKKVTPVVIGEGVHDLENTDLTNEKREAIAVAVGVPISKVMPSAANYATKRSDDVDLVNDTIQPELMWLAPQLNEQLFEPLGLRIAFRPQELPEMQADENERADALVKLTQAGFTLLAAVDTLGFDIPQKHRRQMERLEEARIQAAEAGAVALAVGAQQAQDKQDSGRSPEDDDEDDDDEDEGPPPARAWQLARQIEEAGRLERWLRNDPDRDPADFMSDLLSPADKEGIAALVRGKRITESGKFEPAEGDRPIHLHVDPADLADPADLDRLIAEVERWAKREGLDLDHLLTAEEFDSG